METEGPHSDGTADEGQAESNVIRLPRDWLGPRDELVPLGGAQDGPGAGDAAAGVDDGGGGLEPAQAADFWGEDSAAVQDAVQAPAAESILRHAPRRRRHPFANQGFPRRTSYRVSRPRPAPPLGLRRCVVLRAMAAAVAGLLGAGAVKVELLSSRQRATGAAQRTGGWASMLPPVLPPEAPRRISGVRAGPGVVHRTVGRRPGVERHVTPAIARSSVAAVTPRYVSNPVVARTTTPVASAMIERPAGNRSSGNRTSTAERPASQVPTTSASSTSSRPASGNATPFAPNGVLGPGSSPDG